MASSFFNRGISPAAFTGRAVPPAEADPVTTGLINKNSLQLAVVSNQIQGLTAQMNSLVGSLQVIGNSLATSQAIERQKEQQEQRIQQRLAEQQLQEGKESVIEKKIQLAAAAPAQKVTAKAQFTLGRLTTYLFSVLGGWLLVKGVETIKALSEGNKDKLNEIKANILRGLAVATGVFVTTRFGLKLLTLSFSNFGSLLLAAAAVGLFKDPISQLFELVKDAGRKALNLVTGNNDDGSENLDSTSQPDAAQLEQQSKSESGASVTPPTDNKTTPAEVSPKPNTTNVEPQETVMGDKPETKTETGKGDVKGEKTPAVGGPSLAMGTETLMGKPKQEKGEEEVDSSISPAFGYAKLNAEQDSGAPSTTGSGDPSANMFSAEGNKAMVDMSFNMGDIKSFVDTEKYIAKTGQLPVGEMFTPIKKDSQVASRVGPAPEPPVNIVPISTPSDQPAPKPRPVASGGINNAPSYATSNADNIYTLGAMSNFNVVMA